MICICVSVRIAKCIGDNLRKVSSICSTNSSVVNMSDYYQDWGLLTLSLNSRIWYSSSRSIRCCGGRLWLLLVWIGARILVLVGMLILVGILVLGRSSGSGGGESQGLLALKLIRIG